MERFQREVLELRRSQLSRHLPDAALLLDPKRNPIEGEQVFLPFGAIPDLLIKAVIAAEDPTFFSRNKVERSQYAQSIPRLLAHLLYVLDMHALDRAMKLVLLEEKELKLLPDEVILGTYEEITKTLLEERVTNTFSKEQILEIYLNQSFLGRGTNGVGAAAQRYFGKPVQNLELHEAAYIAGLLQAPNRYDPVRKPEKALERRNWVIGRMVEHGYIDRKTADEAKLKPLGSVLVAEGAK